MHAVEIARELGIPTVLVPRFPGITSGLGCVLAPLRHDFVQSVGQPLAHAATAEIDGRFANQAAAGRRLLDQDGVPLTGPAIVEQPDTTVVIDPGATAVVDSLCNLVISVGAT